MDKAYSDHVGLGLGLGLVLVGKAYSDNVNNKKIVVVVTVAFFFVAVILVQRGIVLNGLPCNTFILVRGVIVTT